VLTEEWLLNFGFDNYDELSFVDKGGFECKLGVILDGGVVYVSPTEGATSINCQYVHQLQNIVFALTGKELSISAKKPLLK
jgi:hypothetical protein